MESGHRKMSFGKIDNRGLPTKAAGLQAEKLRRQFLVERLHALGPAPLGHFLREIEAGADVNATLETYARLPRDFIKPLGAPG